MKIPAILFIENHHVHFPRLSQILDHIPVLDSLMASHSLLDSSFINIIGMGYIFVDFFFRSLDLPSLVGCLFGWVRHLFCLELAHGLDVSLSRVCWLLGSKLIIIYILHSKDPLLRFIILTINPLLLKSGLAWLHPVSTSLQAWIFLHDLLGIPASLALLEFDHGLLISFVVFILYKGGVGELADFAPPFLVGVFLRLLFHLVIQIDPIVSVLSRSLHFIINLIKSWPNHHHLRGLLDSGTVKASNNAAYTWHSSVLGPHPSFGNDNSWVILFHMVRANSTNICLSDLRGVFWDGFGTWPWFLNRILWLINTPVCEVLMGFKTLSSTGEEFGLLLFHS